MSIKSIKAKIKDICKSNCGVSQETLIGKLNPVIIGWANYHSGNIAKEVFGAIDKYILERLWKWAEDIIAKVRYGLNLSTGIK
ncbi:MAG: group II intron maturase-specific domain-containing protein [Candidatus Marithrix sp.]